MDIQALKRSAQAQTFPNGSIIIREGDNTNDAMYIILEGKVDVFKNFRQPSEKKLAELSAGNFFGEMTLFLHMKRSATIVTQGTVILLVVGRETAHKFFETQPQLTYAVMEMLCRRITDANSGTGIPSEIMPQKPLFAAIVNEPPKPAPVAQPTPSAPLMISDNPTPEQLAEYMAKMGVSIADVPAGGVSKPGSLPADLFPEGHQVYDLKVEPGSTDIVYKKNFKCPICEKAFQGYSIRHTRLKLLHRDKDFRSHYPSVDPIYYEIITCPECYFTMLESAYTQPIIARFKESINQISPYKGILNMDLVEDRGVNPVFAGYYLALKGAPLFYKNCEMFVAKIWLRLKWLYHDVKDKAMEEMAAKKAHAAYLSAFEKTDASPEAIQQLCVLMGELSLIVKDMPSAKMFFVKARTYRNGSKAMLSQAEDGIETIRKIESGAIKL
ncbi:MAG: DUF2225 domain-containing protein [Defluviitaleaceae bacterium]|nr:DUF2225 domain-containing protein [Defluviitaleaceae bacterium]